DQKDFDIDQVTDFLRRKFTDLDIDDTLFDRHAVVFDVLGVLVDIYCDVRHGASIVGHPVVRTDVRKIGHAAALQSSVSGLRGSRR
ncbi:hypothetical protein R0J90_18820, partial [Micrococcus sp. SIMBA_144]